MIGPIDIYAAFRTLRIPCGLEDYAYRCILWHGDDSSQISIWIDYDRLQNALHFGVKPYTSCLIFEIQIYCQTPKTFSAFVYNSFP